MGPNATDGHIHAPWTMAQVEGLNTWQASGQFHPYTCGNGHGPLIATLNGWVCLSCDYTQDWAHAFSVIYPEVRSADTITFDFINREVRGG